MQTTTARPPRIRFGDEQAITVGDLAVGDFVIVLPTQTGIRGVKIEALIESIVEHSPVSGDTLDRVWGDDLDADSPSRWRARGAARGTRVAARTIHTRLGAINVPTSCTIVVRRPEGEVAR